MIVSFFGFLDIVFPSQEHPTPAEAGFPGEHIVEDAAQGVEGGADVELLLGHALPLLGSGVGRGEQEAAVVTGENYLPPSRTNKNLKP